MSTGMGLSWANLARLTWLGKWVVFGFISLIVMLVFVLIDMGIQHRAYVKETQLTEKLKKQFEQKQQKYGEYTHLNNEIEALEAQWKTALRALPKQTNIDELLKAITNLGDQQKLTFVYFKPQEEKRQGDYLIQPIKLAVSGQFHAMATFLSQIAHLKPLITLDDFVIQRTKKKSEILTLHLLAQLYTAKPVAAVDASKSDSSKPTDGASSTSPRGVASKATNAASSTSTSSATSKATNGASSTSPRGVSSKPTDGVASKTTDDAASKPKSSSTMPSSTPPSSSSSPPATPSTPQKGNT